MAKHSSATNFQARTIRALSSFIGNLTGDVTGDVNLGVASLVSTAKFTTVALTGTTYVIDLDIPIGSWLIGHSLNVDVEISDDDGNGTWTSAYSGGSTVAIGGTNAKTINTKVSGFTAFETATPDALVVTASAVSDITLTPNGTNFDGGVISGYVLYLTIPEMADVS